MTERLTAKELALAKRWKEWMREKLLYNADGLKFLDKVFAAAEECERLREEVGNLRMAEQTWMESMSKSASEIERLRAQRDEAIHDAEGYCDNNNRMRNTQASIEQHAIDAQAENERLLEENERLRAEVEHHRSEAKRQWEVNERLRAEKTDLANRLAEQLRTSLAWADQCNALKNAGRAGVTRAADVPG